MTPDPEWRIGLTVFNAVLLAELGAMSQWATLFFAAESPQARAWVFLGAAAAMLLVAGLAVLTGAWIVQQVSPRLFHAVAGAVFIVIGLWSLRSAIV